MMQRPLSVEADGAGPAVLASREQEPEAKKKKKKARARSAWISFTGRILAQIVGAVATIFLGVYVVDQYKAPRAGEAAGGAVAIAPAAPSRLRASDGETALAVLPIQNFSGDSRQDFFADGTTEALIAELAQLKGLRVISRTSSMHYKGGTQPLPQIAQELGVDWIVEGSVVVSAGRMRVTAQLIDARRDEHVWAHSYDEPSGDVLRLQARVAAAIATAVGRAVAARETPASGTPNLASPAVYDRPAAAPLEQVLGR
jgi:TolB-like protein